MKLDAIKAGGFVPSDEEMSNIHKALGEVTIVHDSVATFAEARGASADIDELTAVQDHLSVSCHLNAEEQRMVAETMLWIQHVTVGVAKNAGWSSEEIADPDRRNTSEYWRFVEN